MRVAIMQPYFLPYIGYWQLMHNVDCFVIYDDVEYTKKGWINRNRFLQRGQPEIFTLPLKKDSDFLDICQRRLSGTFSQEKMKLVRRLQAAYRQAPYFDEGDEFIHSAFSGTEDNLFGFIYGSIRRIHAHLGMKSQLVISSTLGLPGGLKGQDRVVAICEQLGATDYINPIGGMSLYDRGAFLSAGIKLHFQKVRPVIYRQFGSDFVPNLSIIDNVMFLGGRGTQNLLNEMDLL